jgi:hypothetical protein
MSYSINSGLSIQPAGDETIILNRNNHQIHQLNQVATFIWNALSQGEKDIPYLVSKHFNVDISTARNDYKRLLSELLDNDLISNVGQ